MRVTRRQYLATAGAAAAGLGAVGTVAADHDQALPDHVSLTFPREEMEQYRPLLATPSNADFDSPTWYGWKASSPEQTYDCYVYFAFYEGQTGWSYADSHRGDREPFYVFVHSDFGEVREVVYTGWHWMAARSDAPNVYYPDGSDGKHVTARTYAPHHQFRLSQTTDGALFDVEPLGTDRDAPFEPDAQSHVTFERWLAGANSTGPWEDALAPGAAQNPWVMKSRDSWWRDGEERTARWVWSAQLDIAQTLGGWGPAEAAANTDLAATDD
jgi:hypothetical protein